MTWAKLDDTFHHHPKRMEVSLAAVGLFALGLSYSTDNLTDGRLPERWVLGQLVGEDDGIAAELVTAGLWDEADGGYVIHDYADYNPTRQEWLSRRDKERDKKRDQRGVSPGDNNGTAPGTPGSGSGKEPAAKAESQEFEDWLDHYRETTDRKTVKGSKPARDQFRQRRADGYSLDDLKLATVGCHGDEFCRTNGHDIPETILRASKVTRYIELGRTNGGRERAEHPYKDDGFGKDIRTGLIRSEWDERFVVVA